MTSAAGIKTIVLRYSLKLPVLRVFVFWKYCSTACLRSEKKTEFLLLKVTFAIEIKLRLSTKMQCVKIGQKNKEYFVESRNYASILLK